MKDIICSSCNKNITKEAKEYEKLGKTYSYTHTKEVDHTKPRGERVTRNYSCRDCFHPANHLSELNEKYRKIKEGK
tara:strand:+ start:1862 stop:2089 length:228 start_codon:yes stop_codon:yes gene_type:complete